MVPSQFILLAGANGSGKTTSAPEFLPASVRFINADDIARNLTEDVGGSKNVRAGRLLLDEWDQLEAQQANFAVETTLASRSLASRIARLRAAGYQFHLIFFWLENADLSVARVAERVRQGGHDIPEVTIRRRYAAGIRNLFALYLPLADTWRIFDNTRVGNARQVASGTEQGITIVYERETWQRIMEAGI